MDLICVGIFLFIGAAMASVFAMSTMFIAVPASASPHARSVRSVHRDEENDQKYPKPVILQKRSHDDLLLPGRALGDLAAFLKWNRA